jgi:hypothetical protein
MAEGQPVSTDGMGLASGVMDLQLDLLSRGHAPPHPGGSAAEGADSAQSDHLRLRSLIVLGLERLSIPCVLAKAA